MFRVLYFYLTRMSLDIFNCLPTTPPDGSSYMAGLLQYPCGGYVQKAMLFPAIVSFIGYSIAVPAVALWFLRSKKNIVKYDMVCGLRGARGFVDLFKAIIVSADSLVQRLRRRCAHQQVLHVQALLRATVPSHEAWEGRCGEE